MQHKERKHSKFSASGSERWFNCPGSVELSEKAPPSKDSVWSLEGTKAHERLEELLKVAIETGVHKIGHARYSKDTPIEMARYVVKSANFILELHLKNEPADLLIETRIHLPFIDKEMFGTFDAAVVRLFDTLHVIDFKYGAGHAVSPTKNLQMIFYAIGLAERYDWNFKKVRMWIEQPRIKGYHGPMYWEVGILELKKYVGKFRKAVQRVKAQPELYVEGSWCHWCNAKSICPLKQKVRLEQAKLAFTAVPIQKRKMNHG